MRARSNQYFSPLIGPGGSALCRIIRARTARHLESAIETFLQLHFDHRCFLLIPPAGQKLTSYLPASETGSDLRRRIRGCVPEGDPWFHQCPPRPERRVIKHSDHLSCRQWKKTSFFQNYPNAEQVHYGLTIVIWGISNPLSCITLVRGSRDGDFTAEHQRCLEAAYEEVLMPAITRFIKLAAIEEECHALREAFSHSNKSEVIVRSPDKVISGTPSGLRILESWKSGRESRKVGRYYEALLPEGLSSWCAAPERNQPHERWNVVMTPVAAALRGRSKYFVLRFTDQVKANKTFNVESLSFASREILHQLANGKTNREIAESRGVSHATARNQISALLQRLGLRNRTELALFYHRIAKA